MAVNTDVSLFRSPVGSNRIGEGFIIREGKPEPLSPLVRSLVAKWLGCLGSGVSIGRGGWRPAS